MENENNSKPVTNFNVNQEKQHSIDNENTEKTAAEFATITTSATSLEERGDDNGPVTLEAVKALQQMEQESATKLQSSINSSTFVDDANSDKSIDKLEKHASNSEETEGNNNQMPIVLETVVVVPSTNDLLTIVEGEKEKSESITKTTTSPTNCNDISDVTATNTEATNVATTTTSPAASFPSIRYTDLIEKPLDIAVVVERKDVTPPPLQQSPQQSPQRQLEEQENIRKQCDMKLQQQRVQHEQQMEQLKAALAQKDNMIMLFQRENAILEKEKEAFRKEKDFANKERESTVIKFAMKEKSVIDAKKEKDGVEKQLADAKKEIKNYTTKFQALNEEKSRITYLMDEKCNEVRKYQRECEKLKTDYGHLESKLKYHMNKLNMETEAKLALEKKLEEERNAPNKMEEKANEKLKIEFEAQTILLKHEIASKTEHLERLLKETESQKEHIRQLQEQLKQGTQQNLQLSEAFKTLQEEHNHVQNAYSEEMLNSAKLRGQLDELQLLKTQNTLNEEKIASLNAELNEKLLKLQDNEQDLEQLHAKERELLSLNKEMSESSVDLQNEICLLKSKAQGIEAENALLKKEKSSYNDKIKELENQLQLEKSQKNEERVLLAKHLSEKTKLYENTKLKLENVQGDFEATKNKHATIVKELQREIGKFKRTIEQNNDTQHRTIICSKCQQTPQSNGYHQKSPQDQFEARRSHSRQSSISTTVQSISSGGSRRGSESSESDTVTGRELDFKDENKGPSKKHLVERILRLQQASARQAEKIDFLEQHTLSLVAELQKKSKVVQYYMLRDQAGALTSSKSDQNKSELAKYGNGVMSAIYGGIKGVENKSMSLDLSLEINKKLQAVLEDTLLKNITLKENLDVLGLEVDNLTRKLRQIEAKA